MDKKQLLSLRKNAHKLRPIVIIGTKGLTASVHEEINLALNAHELIKIKINAEDNSARASIIEEICTKHLASKIQLIGHIVTIFRENQEV